jgi:teichoic acid transport system permease protein
MEHEADTDDSASALRPLVTDVTARQYIRSVWARRDFAFALPFEELRTSHLDTFLGNIWHLGNPMFTAGVYYMIFGVFLGANKGIDNYIVWLIIGVFAYQLTSATILGGASSIASRQGLMRSFRFPRAIVPISSAIGKLLSYGFQLGVIAVAAFASGVAPSRRWLLLPAVLLVHTAFNLGGAFIAARLNDGFRDVQQLIPFVLRLAQYMSGVMFSIDRILGRKGWIDTIVLMNPMVSIIDFYRWIVLGTPVRPGPAVLSVFLAGAVLVFGFRFFVAAEHRYGKP